MVYMHTIRSGGQIVSVLIGKVYTLPYITIPCIPLLALPRSCIIKMIGPVLLHVLFKVNYFGRYSRNTCRVNKRSILVEDGEKRYGYSVVVVFSFAQMKSAFISMDLLLWLEQKKADTC